MITKKRIISLFLSLLMILSVFPITDISIFAETDVLDYLAWEIIGGEVTITDCNTSISGDVTIPDTIEGYPVTTIDENAFSKCDRLISVTIPNNVTSIDVYAFSNCDSLETIIISGSVTSIGEYLFTNSCNLKNFIVAEDNTYYSSDEYGVLFNKDKTELIYFPPNNSITEYTIPDGVKTITDEAFDNCYNLESVTIPYSVTSIAANAFYDCNSLKNITVAEDNAYYSNDEYGILFNKDKNELIQCPRDNSITEYIIPNSVTSIDAYAFYYCNNLEDITIPDSVTLIGFNAFDGTAYYNRSSNWENGVLYINNHLIAAERDINNYEIKQGTITIASYAFEYCGNLETVTIPSSVVSISDNAFHGCRLNYFTVAEDNAYYSNDEYGVLFNKDKTELIQFPRGSSITEYTVPKYVSTIGTYAFFNCAGLNNINLPESLTYIDDGAFYLCTSIENIEIPTNVTHIGKVAFAECFKLKNITIPENVETLGFAAFTTCYSLESIDIQAKLKTIEDSMFYCCISLNEITLPETVTYIGEVAFYYCLSLYDIKLPENLTYIGEYAFGCTPIKNIVIPASVNIIEKLTFIHCHYLKHIYINNPQTIINRGSIAYTDFYVAEENYSEYVECSKNMYIKHATEPNADVTYYEQRRDELLTMYEKYIRIDDVFIHGYNESTAQTYAEKNDITFIPYGDDGCIHQNIYFDGAIEPTCKSYGSKDNLYCADCNTKIYDGELIAPIDCVDSDNDYACDVCGAISNQYLEYEIIDGEVTITSCDTSISGEVVIPDTIKGYPVTIIGNNAFASCYSIETIDIPNSVTTIEYSAFSECWRLKNVTIPNSVTTIGDCAFASCYSIETIDIPDSVTTIGDGAFTACYSLKEVNLPNNLKTINPYLFIHCISLESIDIPASVTEIEEEAFHWCTGLEEINLSANLTYIDNTAFGACISLKNIDIPAGVTKINALTFYWCWSLESISFPEGIEYIEDSAIWGMSDSLKDIYIYNSNAELVENSISNIGFSFDNAYAKEFAELYSEALFLEIESAINNEYSEETNAKLEEYYNIINSVLESEPDTILSDLTIHGHTDSTAQIYAETNNINFISLDDAPCSHDYVTTVTPPTCTEQGYTTYTCSKCGDTYVDDYVDATDHDWGDGVIAPESTCNTHGTKTYTCQNDANHTYTEEVVLNKNNHIGETYIKDAKTEDCTNDGYTGDTYCADCNTKIADGEVIPATGHDWNNWTTVTPATCETDGLEKRICKNASSHVEENVLPSLGHDFLNKWTVDVKATCETVGSKSRHCSRCEAKTDITEIEKADHLLQHSSVPSTCKVAGVEYDMCLTCFNMFNYNVLTLADHTWGDWSTVTEPDCITTGLEKRICSVCDIEDENVLPATGHDYVTTVTPPTCENQGYTTYTCSKCGDTYVDDYVNSTGHSFGEWTETVAPTFINFGEKSRICANCGKTETTILDKLVPAKEIVNEETGVSVSVKDDTYEGDVTVDVSPVYDGESYQIINAQIGNFAATVFDITTYVNGEKTQPSGVVLVKIPIPAGYNPETLIVYHLPNDGSAPQKMNSYVDGNYICFETNHFSEYVIIDESQNNSDTTTDCYCNCHSTKALVKFFYKIARFFWKLFSMEAKRICVCGTAHW